MDQLEGMSQEEIDEYMKEREAKTRAKLLEIIGDLPDADMKPPENVLFVCKLNTVTTDEDLELIFSRFGKINSCEVIRDRKTGDSLCYAFIEFDREEDCENAYFKMDNVLIDDRRIHVDFSQSVSKVKWKGKGTGTGYFEDNKNFGNNEEEKKSKFKINSKSRKGEGYDLIIDDEAENGAEHGKDKKYELIKPHNQTKNYQRRDETNEKHMDYRRTNRNHYDDDEYRNNETKKYKYDSESSKDRYKSDRSQHHHRDRYSPDRDRDRDRNRDRESNRSGLDHYKKEKYENREATDNRNKRYEEKKSRDDHRNRYESDEKRKHSNRN